MAIEGKMLKMTKFILAVFLTVSAHAADSLKVFKAGDTAKAIDVNSNFKLLWDRLDALTQENQGLKKVTDSLKTSKPSPINLDSINERFSGIASQINNLKSNVDSTNLILIQKYSDITELKTSSDKMDSTLNSLLSRVSIDESKAPIAYGYVADNGIKRSGTDNFSVGIAPNNTYIICLPGTHMELTSYPMVVTPGILYSRPPSMVSLSSTGNGGTENCTIVEFWKADGSRQISEFSFAIYKGRK